MHMGHSDNKHFLRLDLSLLPNFANTPFSLCHFWFGYCRLSSVCVCECVRTRACVCVCVYVSRLKYEATEGEVCEVNQGDLLLQGGGQAAGLRGF